MFRWVYCGFLYLVAYLLRVTCYGGVLRFADLLVFLLLTCVWCLALLWFVYYLGLAVTLWFSGFGVIVLNSVGWLS